MQPINFKEGNFTFTKPKDMTDQECGDLNVFKGIDNGNFPVIISKWQPNEADKEAIAKGEGIYLHIYGQGMPPVYLGTENPFENEQKEKQQVA